MNVRALVVDDETIIAEDLAFQLNERSGWHADHCCDPTSVPALIAETPYDVCFLDIEMPGQSGIALARQLKEEFPDVILVFATAFAEHAATAYRLPAADYLVKPVGRDLLAEACDRVEEQVNMLANGDSATAEEAGNSLIAVKSVGRTDYIKIADIILGQAAGNYVRLQTAEKEYLHRCPFSEMVTELEAHGFVRCHRSFFVNRDNVVSFVRSVHAGDELVLDGDFRAPVSQTHRKSIESILSGTI